MAVPSYTEYKFLPPDRADLYGDDQLVFLDWDGNLRFTTGACFRLPKKITWQEFMSSFVARWFSVDPRYDPNQPARWTLVEPAGDRPLDPRPEDTFESLGIRHKATIVYQPIEVN
jgi:phenol hydroxylase P4 protein